MLGKFNHFLGRHQSEILIYLLIVNGEKETTFLINSDPKKINVLTSCDVHVSEIHQIYGRYF